MVSLSNIKKGDSVIFKNRDMARVNDFIRYTDQIDLYFDRHVLGRTNSRPSWSCFNNGIWAREDTSTPCNDIVKIIVDTQTVAE